MRQVALVYGSQYGSTERYAQWVAQQLTDAGVQTVLLPAASVSEGKLAHADAVVAGLSDYGGLLTGAAEIKKVSAELRVKPLFLFTVSFSGLEGASQEKLDDLLRKNLGEPLVDHASATFHFRGALDHTGLSLKHKTVMIGIRSAIAAIPKKSVANQQMLDSFTQKTVDYSSKEQSQPLVAAVLEALK